MMIRNNVIVSSPCEIWKSKNLLGEGSGIRMVKVGDSGVLDCANFEEWINCIGVESELASD